MPAGELTAISLYAGAGLSDFGYMAAGFNLVVQVEANAYRAAIGADNFPNSTWLIGDVRKLRREIVSAYRRNTTRGLDLLIATPPCQGMSSSNPSRGKRNTKDALRNQSKNSLILDIVPIAKALRPRVIVAENVRQLLTFAVRRGRTATPVIEILKSKLREYTVFAGTLDVADYGVPQNRKRCLIIAVRNTEPWVEACLTAKHLPWPKCTHGDGRRPWVTVGTWLRSMKYEPLDAISGELARGDHPLHFVPSYDPDRYLQVSSIPKNSGRSAYQNDRCPDCDYSPVPVGRMRCNACAGLMRNRPYVLQDRKPRLVAGFHSSYRRMHSRKPAPTVTTNSSHVGSDYKIHPFENRVLSILECADIQTIPRLYKWERAIRDGRTYTIRNVVGEAFPPFFTYLHGRLLRQMLMLDGQNHNRLRHLLSQCDRIRRR